MSLFLDKYDEVVNIAKRISQLCGKKFEAEELVNESWIRFRGKDNIDAPLFTRSIQYDMLDYVRTQLGRKTKKYRINFITNILDFGDEESPFSGRQHSILHGSYIDHNLEKLENREYANHVISSILDPRTRLAVKEYFLKGKKLKEVGALINKSESKVSLMVKDCINQLRTEEHSKL